MSLTSLTITGGSAAPAGQAFKHQKYGTGLLVALLSPGLPILIGIDETIERRKGEKITAKGVYRDAVRSTQTHVVRCFGLKWIAMMMLVKLPWNQRCWALPFLTVLAPSEAANLEAKGRHKTTVDWTMQMVKQVSRWLNRRWVLIGDGAYACVQLGWVCIIHNVTLISRLRLDARLYDFPRAQPAGKRGPKPKKGKRLASMENLSQDANQPWETVRLNWYGNTKQTRELLTGTALWYTRGQQPMPIRWVMVADPLGKDKVEAFFSTDLELTPIQIVEWFVLRWGVEVTFEEVRAHLGVETQRQWSDSSDRSPDTSSVVTCFKTNPIDCTLLARWDNGYTDPWLILTDLNLTEANIRALWISGLD